MSLSSNVVLQESSAALVQNSRHFIAFARLDGTLVYLNETGQRLVGLVDGGPEIVDRRLSELFPDEHARLWDREVMPRVLHGEIWRGEWSFRHVGTGAVVPVVANVFAARDAERDLAQIIVEAQDLMTRRERDEQRMELERQLQQAIKMEAVGRLAGGIAHDFNNLLTAMAGFSEIVLDHLDEGDPLREGAEQTLKTCHRSAGMIRQLLTVSRRRVLQPVVMDLNQLVKEVGKLLQGLIGEDVRFRMDISGEPATVRADPAQMEQVLLNLVVNARDAMPGGGDLVVSLENVEVDATHARLNIGARCGPHVHISVSDTGEGMDRDTLAHVFEPFFTTKKGKGSGLGLASVYGIVRQSQGHISVDSTPGRGTTFHIYLPRIQERAPLGYERESVGSSTARAGETVLVVEDDNVVRLVVREGLKRAGYHVLEARDGTEALEVVASHGSTIHLLLSDVVLPGMNGLELASRIEEAHPGLRTLFMSGHAEETVLEHGAPAGDLELLEKPFTRTTLTRRVRELLAS